ncbi:hypothetical protein BGZ70_009221 [Mortierella alpina]|uniref:Uncharacterized protein n=1 Tax=Mortierella alpina TaxID=64518 RepID=A0A9P6J1R2_MORAP|nr:hypothetical protein BGZ70_009221 [Mortierella alpina]
MASTSSPSPIPFVLLGLITGGILLYVSYWDRPPGQRRNSGNLRNSSRRSTRNNRISSGQRANNSTTRTTTASDSGTTSGLRRSNATRRTSNARQQPQHHHHRNHRSRSHDQSELSSSDEEVPRGRGGFRHHTDEDTDISDHEYAALVDEEGYERIQMDDTGDRKHEGLQLMNLLYAIAEDQAGKGGITCNSCGTVPIRGLRYKCANCQDYDLCEGCEAAEVHIKSHVFMKIRIPIPPLANSRTKKLPPFYPGVPKGNTTIPEHMLQELLQKTHFDNVELDAMYNQYLSLSTLDQEGGGITRLTFEQALGPLGLEKNLITERIFRFFDQDENGTISFKEMACGLSVLCKGNFDEKIDFAFQGYDLDGDGYISREELHEMFKAYFYLSMELIRDVVKTMENDLISNFEFQAGMPLSSTFTAPIPREIGVRSGSNSSAGNQAAEEHRQDQESQVSTPAAEWSLSAALSDDSSTTSAYDTLATSSSTEGELTQDAGESTRANDCVKEEQEDAQRQELPVEGRTLPEGTYGLVESDLFVDDVTSDDEMQALAKIIQEAEAERLVSPTHANHESPSELSGADDSGVDSNEWRVDNQSGSSVHPLLLSGSTSASSSQQPWSVSATATRATTSSAGNHAAPAPRQRTESLARSAPDQNNAGTSSSARARPRKDQPLPPTTGSSHLRTPSISNTNLAWDRPTPRGPPPHPLYSQTSAPASIPGPSLAPALAIGFGMTQPLTASTSPTSHQDDGACRESRSTHLGDSRRQSAGVPYQSYASSSYANANYFSSTFPVMESISQDAIQEMVEKTFSAIANPKKPGFITLEEFRAYVLTDAGILGWFDALGSIF